MRQYGERTERGTPVTRTSTGKLPPRATQPPANAADLKDKMEQQLREQRAAHQQKRALEMSQTKGLVLYYIDITQIHPNIIWVWFHLAYIFIYR